MIFISYRHSDSFDFAMPLAQHLQRRYGADAVFFDKDSLREGTDFPQEIRRTLRAARVVLVLAGESWETAPGDQGMPRLMELGDWVRQELQIAFEDLEVERDRVVVPVLRRRRGRLFERDPAWENYKAWDAFAPVIQKLKDRVHVDFRDEPVDGPILASLCERMEAAIPALRDRALTLARQSSDSSADEARLRQYLEALVRETAYLKQPRGIGPDRPFMIHRDLMKTEVALLVPKASSAEASERGGALASNVRGSRQVVVYERHLLSKWLAPGRCLVIAAGPGSGKSSLLEGQAFAMANAALVDPAAPLPVFIRCRDISSVLAVGSRLDDVREIIRLGLHRYFLEASAAESLLERFLRALAQGNATLLFDGLDELDGSEPRRTLCRALVTLVGTLCPNASVVLTSRPFVLDAVRNELIETVVTEANMAPLDATSKAEFIESWAVHFGWSDESVAALRTAVSQEETARLTENVLMLSLVAQLQQSDGAGVPRRRVDVLQRALDLMIERQRVVVGQPAIEPNEVVPQLEYLAAHMNDRRNALISDREACRLFRQLREHEPEDHELAMRTPEELLRACTQALGILVVAERVEDRGRRREHIQFFHPSFCEYLAAAAANHGLVARSTDLPRRLAEHLATLTSLEIPGDNSQAKDHIVEDEDFDHVKAQLAIADTALADRILKALNECAVETPALRRARLTYVLRLLEDEPRVSAPVLVDVLQAVVDSLQEADGGPRSRETALYQALATLLKTGFGDAVIEALVRHIDHSSGDARLLGAFVLEELAYRSDTRRPPEVIGNVMGWLERVLHEEDPSATFVDLLTLGLDFEIRQERWRAAPKGLVVQLIERLLAALGHSALRDLALIKALDNLTFPWGQGNWHRADSNQIRLDPAAVTRVEWLLRQPCLDDSTFSLGARLLRNSLTLPSDKQDWFLLAAHRADGLSQSQWETRTKLSREDRWAWLLDRFTPSMSPRAANRLSVTLGGFLLYSDRTLKHLCEVVLTNRFSLLRGQALIALAMSRAPCAAPTFQKLLDLRADASDDGEKLSDDAVWGLFGLILVDDVTELEARAHGDVRPAIRVACERALRLRSGPSAGLSEAQ